MGLRHRSIRLRVGILIVVPVLCLIGLYAFAASITLGNALNESHAKSLRDALLVPLGSFQQKLDNEQRLAVLSLATPGSADLASRLSLAENETRIALAALTRTVDSQSVRAAEQPHEQQAIRTLLTQAQRLSSIRNVVDASAISIPQAIRDYGAITSQGYVVLEAAMFQQSDVPLVTQAMQVISLDQVAQTSLEESDLLAADIARSRFPLEDRVLFGQLAGTRGQLVTATMPLLDPQYRQMVTSSVPAATSTQLGALETTVETTPWHSGPPPAAVKGGLGVFESYSTAIGRAITQAAATLQDQAQHRADSVFLQLILAAGFGLLGTIASVILSLFIGRSLVRQLRGLRESALGLANEKLPAVIRQLRDGQPVELADYPVPAQEDSSDEIEQVQHALNVVQQTAVKSAIDEARLRRGISDVFRNLAGRSQSLLHRQLTLLDGMERRATEPEELEDLFRIDHLTTRMRRHAEGLIILSGETPARGWRQPVPLIDVLRAAVAEVEDYTRIRVLARTRSAVAGHAVADVIHLIAELAENATVFSPPNTPVRIQGDIVGRGFAIEIEDRGLGISPDRLAEVNRDLADPPQFDLSDSDRLGLFIAGQLARRHDISITLQPSVYGGTTAIVLIPMSLVVDEGSYTPDPALPASSSAGQAGRHAALSGAERGRLSAGNGHALSLVSDAAASLPSGTMASAEAIAAADDTFSPAALAGPGGFPAADSFPAADTAGPDDITRPADTVRPVSAFRPPDTSRPAAGPASLPGGGHRIGETAWRAAEPRTESDREQRDESAAQARLTALPAPATPGPAFPGDQRPAPAAPPGDTAENGGAESPVQARPAAPEAAETAPDGAAGTPTDVLPVRRPAGEGRISSEELAELGLPVRVRQASLAPQLRDGGSAPVPPPASDDAPGTGSPEAARSTMSALQRGWQLGRAEVGGWPAATGSAAPESSAPESSAPESSAPEPSAPESSGPESSAPAAADPAAEEPAPAGHDGSDENTGE